ncbi:MAG: DNA polymerase III subunit delta' [Candidatus Omnitrophota bacterium]|jgi:DNA polymerase-3 subunit delta'
MPFSDIKGQDRALEILKAYMDGGRLEGGYLFSGPASVGKKMMAKMLSQALNCAENNSQACGLCPSCLKIQGDSHPDVHIISNGQAQLKIEDVRQLQKEINLRAYEGRYKVFIIDNAHTLTPEAANCLLKVLEEPPKFSLIILITDKPGLLFKTILSRCKIVKFHAAKREELNKTLSRDYGLDINFAHFLSYFSEGRLGEALRLKDSEILNQKNSIIDKFIMPSSSGAEGIEVEDRQDFCSMLNILSAWFRDMYFVKSGMPDSELINFDRRTDLLKIVNRFTYSDLDRIISAISNTILCLERNINTKLLLHNLKAQIWER